MRFSEFSKPLRSGPDLRHPWQIEDKGALPGECALSAYLPGLDYGEFHHSRMVYHLMLYLPTSPVGRLRSTFARFPMRNCKEGLSRSWFSRKRFGPLEAWRRGPRSEAVGRGGLVGCAICPESWFRTEFGSVAVNRRWTTRGIILFAEEKSLQRTELPGTRT